MARRISLRALAIFLGALAIYLAYTSQGSPIEKARTAVFSNLLISLTLMALFSRSEKTPISRLGLGSNRYMLLVLAISLVIAFLVANLGPLQPIFGTMPLGAFDWFLVVAVSLLATGWIEVQKILR